MAYREVDGKFADNLADTSINVYMKAWDDWLDYCEAGDIDPTDAPVDEYIKFLQRSIDRDSYIGYDTALRHILNEYGKKKPPTLASLIKKEKVHKRASRPETEPKAVVRRGDASQAPGPSKPVIPKVRFRTDTEDLQLVNADDVPTGAVISIPGRDGTFYRNTGSAWAELDSLGQMTGAVLTYPHFRKQRPRGYAHATYETKLCEFLWEYLQEIGMIPERSVLALDPEEIIINLAALIVGAESADAMTEEFGTNYEAIIDAIEEASAPEEEEEDE